MKHELYCDADGNIILDKCKICGRIEEELRLDDGECPGYMLPKGSYIPEPTFTGTPTAPAMKSDTAQIQEVKSTPLINPELETKIASMNDLMNWFGITNWVIEKKDNIVTINGEGNTSKEKPLSNKKINLRVLRALKKYVGEDQPFKLSDLAKWSKLDRDIVKQSIKSLVKSDKIIIRKKKGEYYLSCFGDS